MYIAPNDYAELDDLRLISTNRQCYWLKIANDNIPEPVETFRVSLNKDNPSSSVTILNRTLSVVIVDDGGT